MKCVATKKDGSPCKGEARQDGLCIAHLKTAPPESGPMTKLKGLRRARNIRVGVRAVTMVRPICDECQDGENVPHDWYKDCEHDPYVGQRPKTREVPIYSEPLEDGSVVLERMEERITWETWPHLVDVILDPRVDSGNRIAKMQRRGWLLPEEVRSPVYPNGIAPMCQFNRCRWQEGLREYSGVGTFCREDEARIVAHNKTDAEGNRLYPALEVWRQGKRQSQLQAVGL
jgi:hypothetical protein